MADLQEKAARQWAKSTEKVILKPSNQTDSKAGTTEKGG